MNQLAWLLILCIVCKLRFSNMLMILKVRFRSQRCSANKKYILSHSYHPLLHSLLLLPPPHLHLLGHPFLHPHFQILPPQTPRLSHQSHLKGKVNVEKKQIKLKKKNRKCSKTLKYVGLPIKGNYYLIWPTVQLFFLCCEMCCNWSAHLGCRLHPWLTIRTASAATFLIQYNNSKI